MAKNNKTWDTIFADPPDNINLKYNLHSDHIPDEEYVHLLRQWLFVFTQRARCVWFSYNVKWWVEIARIVTDLKQLFGHTVKVKLCVQIYTFGQHNQHDFGTNHRPILRITRKDAPLYPDAIRIQSQRQINGDSRANPAGRVPGDVFDFPRVTSNSKQRRRWHPTDAIRIQSQRQINGDSRANPAGRVPGDVFDFPRVTGNSKQRRRWHPTQLHERLVERCIKMTTLPGERVLDPFGGTGTTLRVCKQISRECTLLEIDSFYCEQIAKENALEQVSENTWSEDL
ncbi:hypothetical protein LCGC14_1455220 [marine sediment metagenome]|uniref:DNA methylase N-4/N-6 domain-containing protein n=1 Tax=marine sediment metagenome TaxID=412755 RepID=A0A0F9JGL9_9ZZZZ